jgi:hypothetical protein
MTASCREQIMAAVLAKLQGITAVAGLSAEQDRAIPLRAEDTPLLILRAGEEAAETIYVGIDSYRLEVQIEGYAVDQSGTTAATTLGQMRAECDKALLGDPTLGGLTMDLRASEEPADPLLDFEADVEGKAFTRSYEIRYSTQAGNPYEFG